MLMGSHRTRQAVLRIALPLLAIAALGGCATLGYYAQAIGGEMDILGRARNIDAVVDDPTTPATTRRKLELVLAVRRFAIEKLDLPDSRSYLTYTDLKRPHALWNVFVAPEFSTTPREWCFPIAGCVSYRGYFSEKSADEFAAERRAVGDDVFVGGVSAYSTLGWFNDPVLSTVLNRSDTELAGLIFHELGHQKLYVQGDSAFDESFATVVELEGVRRWVVQHNDPGAFERYRRHLARRDDFVALVLDYRKRLDALYASNADAAAKRERKRALFDALRADYAKRKERWGGDNGYDAWFAKDLNNAKLAAVGTYYKYVEPLQRLLAEHDGNLPAFYAAAKDLAELPQEERAARLNALRTPTAPAATIVPPGPG
jgi:predicted aminopeptidase